MRCKSHGYADEEEKANHSALGAARGPLPELPKELLDQLVKGPMTPAEVQDLMLAFNKAVIERARRTSQSYVHRIDNVRANIESTVSARLR